MPKKSSRNEFNFNFTATKRRRNLRKGQIDRASVQDEVFAIKSRKKGKFKNLKPPFRVIFHPTKYEGLGLILFYFIDNKNK